MQVACLIRPIDGDLAGSLVYYDPIRNSCTNVSTNNQPVYPRVPPYSFANNRYLNSQIYGNEPVTTTTFVRDPCASPAHSLAVAAAVWPLAQQPVRGSDRPAAVGSGVSQSHAAAAAALSTAVSRAKGQWSQGMWTIEYRRSLTTSSPKYGECRRRRRRRAASKWLWHVDRHPIQRQRFIPAVARAVRRRPERSEGQQERELLGAVLRSAYLIRRADECDHKHVQSRTRWRHIVLVSPPLSIEHVVDCCAAPPGVKCSLPAGWGGICSQDGQFVASVPLCSQPFGTSCCAGTGRSLACTSTSWSRCVTAAHWPLGAGHRRQTQSNHTKPCHDSIASMCASDCVGSGEGQRLGLARHLQLAVHDQ